MRRMRRVLVALALGLALFLVWFERRYGGPTEPFPDRSTPPLLGPEAVEQVAALDQPPGNIAVAPDGRVFFSFHPEARPSLKVVELVAGKAVPWPDASWQQRRGADEPSFDTPLSLRIDRQGRLWSLDIGFHGLRQPRLLAFDLATGALVHRYDFPREIAPRGSYVQDFQVDPEGRQVFLADCSVVAKRPALIVHDVAAGTARRLLERHPSTLDRPFAITVHGRPLRLLGGLFEFHPALDSIALDRRGEWLYYGPMAHGDLFRVRAGDLTDPALEPADLAARVERFGPKPQSDGISIDLEGNVYLTDVEHGALSVLGQDGVAGDRKLRTLVRDSRFRWLDGLSFGPGGWLYATDSALAEITLRSRSHIRASAPYFIWRFQVGRQGAPGH